MTMMRRRPTPPPPMYRALAKTGGNKRCMVGLSFFEGNLFAIITVMTLRHKPPRTNGV
jgi:hypothetical protein